MSEQIDKEKLIAYWENEVSYQGYILREKINAMRSVKSLGFSLKLRREVRDMICRLRFHRKTLAKLRG